MPARPKFTEDVREKILQALRVGASRRTAAAVAGVTEGSLRLWISKGKDASEGRFRDFYSAVQEAEASPRLRALGIVYREMPDNPSLAWKFLERKEPGFEPHSVVSQKQETPEPETKSVIDELASRRTNRA